MLISLPHNVSVNIRPRGVSFPNDEAVSGDNSQTDAEAGLKRRAEVVQPEFEVFLLLQGDVWVGRFRENFLHHDTDDRPYWYFKAVSNLTSPRNGSRDCRSHLDKRADVVQIGRASCRDRAQMPPL